MHGDLFILKPSVVTPSSPIVDSEWYDTWDEWGVGLEEGGLDALMAFRPNKEPVMNKNVTANGAAYVAGAGLVDERTITVAMHIVAGSAADLFYKYSGFYNVIKSGLLRLRVANPVEVTFQLYYVSCSQYQQFLSGMAKYMLTFYESNDYEHDGGSGSFQPMPTEEEMEAELMRLLGVTGDIATDAEIRAIVTEYEPDDE